MGRQINFTKAALAAAIAKSVGEREILRDSTQPGLVLEIRAGGSATFYLYKRIAGRPRRIKLGRFPDVAIEAARQSARKKIGHEAEGRNPAEERRIGRTAPTLGQVFDEFIELPTRTRSKRPKAAKTVADYRYQFERFLEPWRNRQLSAITRADVEKLHNTLGKENGHYLANRLLSLIKALFNCAIDAGYFNANPAGRLRAFEETQRERFLVAEELPKFWAALEAEPNEKIRDFVKLALFTGQRRGNVAAMRWDEVNLERGLWTIPQTKTGRHEVPLIAEAIEILNRRKESAGNCPFVFPGRHGYEHLRDPMRQWREILKRAGIGNLRLHDLRRSMGSWQTATGSNLQTVGKTLGHSQPQTTAIYARLGDATVRASMQTAAAAMMAATKPKEAGKPAKTTKRKAR